MSIANVRIAVSESLHPAAPHHLPGFITAPGESDVLMIRVGIFLIVAVLAVGNFYLHLHSLPERMAHKSQKFQFEIVAVLGLLSLFTHNHLFWIIGLFLAMIDLPDFSTPLRRIAGSVEKMAGVPPEQDPTEPSVGETAHVAATDEARPASRRPVAPRARCTAMLELLLLAADDISGLPLPPLPAGQTDRQGDHAVFGVVRAAI